MAYYYWGRRIRRTPTAAGRVRVPQPTGSSIDIHVFSYARRKHICLFGVADRTCVAPATRAEIHAIELPTRSHASRVYPVRVLCGSTDCLSSSCMESVDRRSSHTLSSKAQCP